MAGLPEPLIFEIFGSGSSFRQIPAPTPTPTPRRPRPPTTTRPRLPTAPCPRPPTHTVQKKIKIYTGIDAIKVKITLGSRKNKIFRVGVGAGAGPKKRLRLHPKTAAPATLVFGTNFIST